VKFTLKIFLTPCLLAAALTTQAIESAKPEALGFSSERLQRLDQAMTEKINNKQLAGAVTLLARHGKAVSFNTYGHQDIADAREMQKDTIFRIYSMTKPITSVAMMMLYEEGKWLPNDPIAKHLPEFKDLKVYAGQDF
jgi:CubicO group peptidase (beta-lactamase class C family)